MLGSCKANHFNQCAGIDSGGTCASLPGIACCEAGLTKVAHSCTVYASQRMMKLVEASLTDGARQ